MLTYERAWSREQIRDARAFAYSFAVQGPACFLDENGKVPRRMDVFDDPEIVWISARDEGNVVATIGTKMLPRATHVKALPDTLPDMVRVNMLGEFDPAYDFDALLGNIRIARAMLIDDPPGTPAVSAGFRGPGLDALQSGVFGVGSLIIDRDDGKPENADAVMIVVFPPPRDQVPPHYEVPYANV